MKKLLALLTVITIAFTGCSLKMDKKTADEMPPDRPYNRMILETENGYYYQAIEYLMSLRYFEKSNGTDIFLCAKPECQHSGEPTCTATYNNYNVSNYVLYDGFIYFAADDSDEESFAYSLYRVSLDGSSLDKVAEIMRVRSNQSNEEHGWGSLADICIHKGYAYIPYTIGHRYDYASYIGNGFARVNVQTGKCELLFSHDDYLESFSYGVECGVGDYVYYNSGNRNGKGGRFRYNIKNGAIEQLTGDQSKLPSDAGRLEAITENAIYYHNVEKATLNSCDVNTFKKNDFELDLTDVHNDGDYKLIFYDNKIFVIGQKSIDVYSDTGEFLGSHTIPSFLNESQAAGEYNYNIEGRFDISNGKMYVSHIENINDFGVKSINDTTDDTADYYSVYSCSIEDIINGKGDWEKQYGVKKTSYYWNHDTEIYPGNMH